MCMCGGGMCGRCKAGKKIVIGALVLLNIYVWPQWIGTIDKWAMFVAVLSIILGVLMFVMPGCPHTKEDRGIAKKGKK